MAAATPGVGTAVEDALEQAATDALARKLLPDQSGATQADRDRKDAANADHAFEGILTAATATLEVPAVATAIGLPAIGTAIGLSAGALVASAAAAIRVAWAGMSVVDRARIWRGEV